MNKQQLKSIVGNRFFAVQFTKTDGTTRDMVCRLGVSKGVKGTGKTMPDHLVTVWDANKRAFRSFSLDRVHEIRQGNLTITLH